uniref:Ig-like domain-containing protein n=1 Tax=Cyprinus carpio carpio TaxID=630221 RepID=A0A9J8A1P0_CYPCA
MLKKLPGNTQNSYEHTSRSSEELNLLTTEKITEEERRMKIIWTFTLLMIPGVVSSISVRGYSGGGVNITCRYDREYTDNAKYFCRGEWLTCSDLIRTETKDKWVDSGRFSLFVDTRAAVFTVTFRNLSEQDSGTYWCGVEKPGLDPYTEVNLKVVTDVPNMTTSSSSTSSVFKPSASVSSDMSKVFSGSSLIIFLVLVLLVLIIIGLLLLFIYKKHQSRGGDSSSQTGAGKHEAVSHTGYDYDEIKDTHKKLPTNPSDSSNTVYATPQLPTNPSDSSNTVYATPQLPTNPSDSSVYSTVQEASGDSQIFVTPAEDLNYAVVNFQKKAECPDRVSLRNNQDYSEYAAVNHLLSCDAP